MYSYSFNFLSYEDLKRTLRLSCKFYSLIYKCLTYRAIVRFNQFGKLTFLYKESTLCKSTQTRLKIILQRSGQV